MSNDKTAKKRPQIKMYFSDGEAKAIQAAIDLLSAANGEPIKPQEYGKWCVLTMTEATGQKYADLQAAEKAKSEALDTDIHNDA